MGSGLILKPGSLTTVQDHGRVGSAYFAIPRSGVMDRTSAQNANLLVGNNKDAPILECTLKGPTIQFDSAVDIALTGADMSWKINGENISLNKSYALSTGDILSTGYAKGPLRSYLAIRGQLDTIFHFASCASYPAAALGHNYGQPLAKGDRIQWDENPESTVTKSPIDEANLPQSIIIYKGPEYSLLTPDSKQILNQQAFKVGPDSNRMGARLIGEKMEVTSVIKDSVPVLPGFIQLPPSGQPIVVLQDGQTTGGYPRIAFLKSEEINAFNRLPLGQPFSFILME